MFLLSSVVVVVDVCGCTVVVVGLHCTALDGLRAALLFSYGAAVKIDTFWWSSVKARQPTSRRCRRRNGSVNVSFCMAIACDAAAWLTVGLSQLPPLPSHFPFPHTPSLLRSRKPNTNSLNTQQLLSAFVCYSCFCVNAENAFSTSHKKAVVDDDFDYLNGKSDDALLCLNARNWSSLGMNRSKMG